MDAFTAHRGAVQVWLDRVAGVRPEQWSLPTPCTEWDVRALVGHLVYEQVWTPPLMRGATIEEVGDRFERDLLGADPAAATRAAAAEAAAATPEDGDQDRTVHLSFGDVPAAEYARQLAADHLVHAWDLAAATGGSRELPADLVDAVAAWFAGAQDAYRSGGAVADEVPLPDGASEQDRLLAGFGRDPAWRPPAG